jgi:hypothetical protein
MRRLAPVDADDAGMPFHCDAGPCANRTGQALADGIMLKTEAGHAMGGDGGVRQPDAVAVQPDRKSVHIDGRRGRERRQQPEFCKPLNAGRVKNLTGKPATIVQSGLNHHHGKAELLDGRSGGQAGHPAATNEDIHVSRLRHGMKLRNID